MANHYSPKRFFRQAPNLFLQQYFLIRNVLTELDFSKLSETKIDSIYEAWLELPDPIRKEIEQDFQEIESLSTEGGSKAILDEAHWHGEDLAGQFGELKGFIEHAFWTFLERRDYWNGALTFHHADGVPFSYWRKRKNFPRKPADVDPESIHRLEQDICGYFHAKQERGQNCKVDCYRRNDLDYFFAYPEDYAQASVEWEGKEFKRRPHHPAFEIIFVYSQRDGTLDIYLSGGRKSVFDLQVIFAAAILKEEIRPDEKDQRIYNLSALKSRDFPFVYDIESGIASVAIKKLRLDIHGGENGQITLKADPTHNKYAVYDLLEKMAKGIPLSQIIVTQVGFKVTFTSHPTSKRPNTRSFDISSPNSCSLK